VVVTGRLDQRSWETAEGDRRSKVEITADDLAPSLRWATAEVTRKERRPADEPPSADEGLPEPPRGGVGAGPQAPTAAGCPDATRPQRALGLRQGHGK
jgi:single-strand DNA-binding protein